MQWDWKCKIAERCGSSSRSAQGSWTWKPRRESPRVSAAASKLSRREVEAMHQAPCKAQRAPVAVGL